MSLFNAGMESLIVKYIVEVQVSLAVNFQTCLGSEYIKMIT